MKLHNFIRNLGIATINRAGFMTERQMLASTTKLGRYIHDSVSKGELSSELLGSIFEKSLPKGIKKPDFVTTSASKAEEWLSKRGIKTVNGFSEKIGGWYTFDSKSLDSLIFINPTNDISNVAAHEFRHHLDYITSFSQRFKKLFEHFLYKSQNWRAIHNKNTHSTQKVYNNLEDFLATILGNVSGNVSFTSNHILHYEPSLSGLLKLLKTSNNKLASVLKNVTQPLLASCQTRKEKICLLKYLIKQTELEKHAYTSGAKATRTIWHIKPQESSYSDMLAVLHDEINISLKKELKRQIQKH